MKTQLHDPAMLGQIVEFRTPEGLRKTGVVESAEYSKGFDGYTIKVEGERDYSGVYEFSLPSEKPADPAIENLGNDFYAIGKIMLILGGLRDQRVIELCVTRVLVLLQAHGYRVPTEFK